MRRCRWLAALVVLLGVTALVAGRSPSLPDPARRVLDRWAQHWPQDAGPPLYPDAHDIRRATGEFPLSYVLTYTTDVDYPELYEFYNEVTLRDNWHCVARDTMHSLYNCNAPGAPDALPWNWIAQQELRMLPKGSEVQLRWWRDLDLTRFPIYPSGQITGYKEVNPHGFRHGFPGDPRLLKPFPGQYVVAAPLDQVRAYYTQVLPLCGMVVIPDTDRTQVRWGRTYERGAVAIQGGADGATEVTLVRYNYDLREARSSPRLTPSAQPSR
jgi:hypothetical protein